MTPDEVDSLELGTYLAMVEELAAYMTPAAEE